MREFFYMGGHGLYVWLAYGMAMFILGFNLIKPWLDFKCVKNRIAQ